MIPRRPRLPLLAAILPALALLGLLAACNRKPHLVPDAGLPVAGTPVDSLAVAMRAAQQAWGRPPTRAPSPRA
jgi:hypothetical protein